MLKEIMKSIEDLQKTQYTNYKVAIQAAEVLKAFDGKKCSKRMENAFKKRFPNYTVYCGRQYTWYGFKIWGNGIEYQYAVDLLLTYDDDDFDYEKFVGYNQRYFLEAGRYETLQEIKEEPEKLKSLIEEYENIQKQIEEFKKNPLLSVYPIKNFFNI